MVAVLGQKIGEKLFNDKRIVIQNWIEENFELLNNNV